MGLTPKSLKWAIDIAERAHAIFAEELGVDSYEGYNNRLKQHNKWLVKVNN